MDPFSEKLNALLVDTFRSILKIEEQAVKQTGKTDLSISELHLLEAVDKGKEQGSTISSIALDQGITLPSVTIGINKLAAKGYVEKIKSESDGRRVFVKLTKMGRKVNAGHLYFHENMVRNVCSGMDEQEREALLEGMRKLNGYFRVKIGKGE